MEFCESYKRAEGKYSLSVTFLRDYVYWLLIMYGCVNMKKALCLMEMNSIESYIMDKFPDLCKVHTLLMFICSCCYELICYCPDVFKRTNECTGVTNYPVEKHCGCLVQSDGVV